MAIGLFSPESLDFCRDILESAGLYDFARCVRSDGTYYGTSGKCRKGTEAEADTPENNTKKMVERVKKDVPPGTKVEDSGSGISLTRKTKSGHEVTYNLTRDGNIEFSVNGQWDAGTVSNRKEQIEVALNVKRMHDAVIKNLKPGHILWVMPHESDGLGEERAKAYMAVGFSKPTGEDGMMFSRKGKDGKMHQSPLSPEEEGDLFGSEQDFAEKKEAEDLRLWHKVLFTRPA